MNGKSCGCQSTVPSLLLTFSLLLLAGGCSSQAPTSPEVVRPVRTMIVTPGGETHVRIFPGKVEAAKKAELAFQVSGLIVDLPVKAGPDPIKKGDLIARLREDEFRARLKSLQGELDQARAGLQALRAGERPEERLRREAQLRAAEAKLANAEVDYERERRLVRTGAGSRQEYDRSLTALRVAQEEYQAAHRVLEKGTIGREEDIQAKEALVYGLEGRVVEATIQLEDCTLRAPYDGIVAQRFVEPNQSVKAKQPIVKFQDVDEIRIAVDVPETVMAATLRRSDIVQLLAEFSAAPGLQFPVQIKEIAQKADPTTQIFTVWVGLQAPPDLNLLPGMTATVAFTYRRASVLGNRILVPLSAVLKEPAGEQVVWIVSPDEIVERRPVQLGEASGGKIEIVSGLEAGTRIAVAGVTFLREGMKVRDLGDALGGGQP
jgi:RND family efflux transporter MFP subunit